MWVKMTTTSSTSIPKSFMQKQKEDIILLEELHRPLEEHWAVKSKFGLDPKNSDYIYKHHVTHLEDIYQNHKFIVKEPPTVLVMSPVSQLYGVNGLKSNLPEQKEKEKSKEAKWVSNFQKYNVLDEVHDNEKKADRKYFPNGPIVKSSSQPALNSSRPMASSNTAPASNVTSMSPSRNKKRLDSNRSNQEEDGSGAIPVHQTRCAKTDMTPLDLIMFGMYKLNPRQEEIYNKFVEMLTEFSDFDKESIIDDALHDSIARDVTMDDYGGTILSDP